MVQPAQTVSLFRTPWHHAVDVLLRWQINNTYMIKYPSFTCMLAEEIALGMRVRYPRTGNYREDPAHPTGERRDLCRTGHDQSPGTA